MIQMSSISEVWITTEHTWTQKDLLWLYIYIYIYICMYIYKPHGTNYSITSTCYAMKYFLQYIYHWGGVTEWNIWLHHIATSYYVCTVLRTTIRLFQQCNCFVSLLVIQHKRSSLRFESNFSHIFKNNYNVILFYLYIIIFASIRCNNLLRP